MTNIMSSSKKNKVYSTKRREEILRPCPYLGYDHDNIAMYLLTRRSYQIAESQFRRAIWLNPYEPLFKGHLALCLYYQGRISEAKECLKNLEVKNENPELQTIIDL
ncbi:MAG: tetratricopeptide repeat protein, partial [FCB group bacterium]|nr:tetratricopeptide repeat protein [FCB group bacterium]